MNCKEWKSKCKADWHSVDHTWDKKCREIQSELKYNSDPNATVRHHLRDTEEQRKYNEEHYELWGFEIDENGNEHFEYGKYMIFVTEEWHNNYHHRSEETRKRMRENSIKARDEAWIENQRQKHLGKTASEETRKKMSESHKALCSDPKFRKKMSEAAKASWTDERKQEASAKCSGENNPMYGKKGELAPCYGRCGELNPMYGKTHSEDHSEDVRNKISNAIKIATEKYSIAYKEYKSNGGTMKWNEFKKWYKNNINN